MSSDKERSDVPDGTIPEEALQWLEGNTDPEVRAAVVAWVENAPDRREALEELSRIWRSSRLSGRPADWQDLQARLDALESESRRARPSVRGQRTPAQHPRRARWAPLRVAAVLAIGLGLGLLLPRVRDAWIPPQHATVVVPAASRAELLLPGGVRVALNHASELSYEPSDDVREVRLMGEAYFSVPDGSKRNLLVHTEAGTVRDLGTEFNVRARSGRTAVTVTEGRVRLEAPAGAVALGAGQASSVAVGGRPAAPTAARLDAALGWRTGELTFYDEPLARVAEELERRYGTSIDVSPDLRETRITAKIMRGASAREALGGLCISVQASCDRTDDGWAISK